jgi:hypothetical protein
MDEDLPFKVVRTACCCNLLIGRAAFERAAKMYPKDLIEYRQRRSINAANQSKEGQQ